MVTEETEHLLKAALIFVLTTDKVDARPGRVRDIQLNQVSTGRKRYHLGLLLVQVHGLGTYSRYDFRPREVPADALHPPA
jgi:hypothetical protein